MVLKGKIYLDNRRTMENMKIHVFQKVFGAEKKNRHIYHR